MRWKREHNGVKRSIAPAKLGLLAFLAFCLAVLVWDIAAGGTDGALTAERPAVNVTDLDLPEPAVAVSATPDEEAQLTTEEAAAAVFAAYRLDREQSRSEELELLQTVIDDEAGSPTIRAEAEQRRLAIAAAIEQESTAESLLDAKGFGETVVLRGVDQATVVCAIELDAVKAAQIAEIVASACGVAFENVVIVNR